MTRYECEVVHEPVRDAAVHRFEVDLAEVGGQMASAFQEVERFLRDNDIPITGPAVAYYDVRPEAMDAAAGFIVDAPFEGSQAVEPLALPESEALATIHVGPYDRLSDAYQSLQVHAQGLGRRLDETRMWEEYLTPPDVGPDRLRTRVIWPLRPV